jgi:hypothetical protein
VIALLLVCAGGTLGFERVFGSTGNRSRTNRCREQVTPDGALTYASLVVAAAAFACHAQYSIDWQTVDGDGGTSTGGVYAFSGTIGQPDAGQMAGGNYTLSG